MLVAAAKSPDTGMNERSILLLILAVGALLRLPGLWQFDVWQDEIYSIYEARYLIHSPFGPGGMELRPSSSGSRPSRDSSPRRRAADRISTR